MTKRVLKFSILMAMLSQASFAFADCEGIKLKWNLYRIGGLVEANVTIKNTTDMETEVWVTRKIKILTDEGRSANLQEQVTYGPFSVKGKSILKETVNGCVSGLGDVMCEMVDVKLAHCE
jgi:hypothetical protein